MEQRTRADARSFAALEQVQPAEAIEDAEAVVRAGAAEDLGGLLEDIDGRLYASVLCVGDGDLDPSGRGALLGLEDVA